MALVAFVGRCNQAYHRNAADGYEGMGAMADGVLVLVMRLSESDAVVGEDPAPVLILLTFGAGDGL